MKLRLAPRSLLGQMLLAVAVALLVAQALSAVLLYRAAEQRREVSIANALAFQLVAEPRFDYRQSDARFPREPGRQRWLRLRVQRTDANPLRAGETRNSKREDLLRSILADQGIAADELIATTRITKEDPYVMRRLRERDEGRIRPERTEVELIVAALLPEGESEWIVARIPQPEPERRAVGGIIAQTLILYGVLVGGLALLLRRITRPLAALTARMEHFTQERGTDGQIEPDGPEDTRRLIAAHNAMEAHIAALLDEKDVMLGAIGHDLKTPLAALRVRIESVEDTRERERMAATIEDITRTLDDILSLARVGRPSDDPEATDLAALTASVVEEFEDMGEDIELGETSRIVLKVRATWLRRALRNLAANALRYGGGQARVSLLQEGGAAVFRVEDDGPGIPEDELDTMLEPFRRGEESRNRETGGAGLGLTLARAIAEQHGGSLHLSNRPAADGSTAGLRAEIRLPF